MIAASHAVRVLIATTEGPVEVQSLIEEDPELGRSVVCIDGTTRTAGIDRDYQAFVSRGTGLIERLYEHGAFRLDVSRRVDAGGSWQLAVLIAHALHASGKLATANQAAQIVVWATGQVSPVNLSVCAVGHVTQKVNSSLDRLKTEATERRRVIMVWPKANAPDCDARVRQQLQILGVELIELETVEPILSRLGLPTPVCAASSVRKRQQAMPAGRQMTPGNIGSRSYKNIPRLVRTYSIVEADAIGRWLQSLGLGQYEATFRESEIGADVLPELTETDLEKLGVPLGHRKLLLKAIASLGAVEKSPPGAHKLAPTSRQPEDTAERRQLTVMYLDFTVGKARSRGHARSASCLSSCVLRRDRALRRHRGAVLGRRRPGLLRLSARS